ncbi:hypothetical protein ISS86_01740 [Candidatus Microgenomates bacterium]|nr:hypothetical protein [Candidatus Microgenomates bacterium]
MKMKNKKKVLLFLLVLLIAWLFIRFVIGGSEDSWICEDSQWVKHGHPSAPMPGYACPDK